MASLQLASVLSQEERLSIGVDMMTKLQDLVDNQRRTWVNNPNTATVLANSEREVSTLKMKLQMSEEFVDRMRSQLRDEEDKLQEARKTYYAVIIGRLYFPSCSFAVLVIL